MKILQILILCILMLFPFGELLRFDIGNNIVLKPLDLSVGVTALVSLIIVATKKKKQIGHKALVIAVLIFTVFAGMSLLVNTYWLEQYEFIASLLYLVRWGSYASIFFVVSSFDRDFKNKITKFLFLDGLIVLIFGYVQYFLFPNLKVLYSYGWDDHMYRMFSTFLDPNFMGAFLALYAFFLGGLLYQRQEKHQRTLLIILLFTLVGIFLTFSRSALLMLLSGAIVYLSLIQRKKLLIILIAMIVSFFLIASQKFYIENMNLFREASSNARLDNYRAAVKIISDKPFLGVGFNSYRYAKDLYGINKEWVSNPSHADAGVDNSFLFVLATTGIIGLSAYLFVWFRILQGARKAFFQKKDIIGAVLVASICGVFVDAMFINSLFYSSIMLWLWMLIGLVE